MERYDYVIVGAGSAGYVVLSTMRHHGRVRVEKDGFTLSAATPTRPPS